MYITSTIRTKSSRLAKPVLCLVTLCSAFLTGLNRVSEYRNHCSDVLAGFVLGTAVALFLVRLSQGSASDEVTVKDSSRRPLYVFIYGFIFSESERETADKNDKYTVLTIWRMCAMVQLLWKDFVQRSTDSTSLFMGSLRSFSHHNR